MNSFLFIALIVILVALLVLGVAVLLDVNIPGLNLQGGGKRANMKNLMSAQRTVRSQAAAAPANRGANLYDVAAEGKVERKTSSQLTLRKKLKFARWKMPPVVFNALRLTISLVAFALASIKLNIVLQLISLTTGPLFMGWLLNNAVERRFKLFDSDYPAFLLSLVGLLKTGMNPMQALEAAAYGLNEGSLVKAEVEMMVERLRFGVSEDKSIGSFGEDVFHPEIELFVQALLLSRRVGGNLSDTLDRLAKQVRKRQYFRSSANAAVGMQRGSIWFILAIMVGLEVYLGIVAPDSVAGAWKDDVGKQVWQTGVVLILLGVYWVRQVTRIKV